MPSYRDRAVVHLALPVVNKLTFTGKQITRYAHNVLYPLYYVR